MKSLLILGVVLATAVMFSALAQTAKPAPDAKPAPAKPFKNVGVEEFDKLRAEKTNIVLDVRTEAEYKEGHIPGAILIDVKSSDFEAKVAKLDKSKTYLVHCAGGVRSAAACSKLAPLNFTSLYNLAPGFKAWKEAGKPIEK